MKKLLLGLIAIVSISLTAHGQEAKISSHVTADEYKNMDSTEKRISDYIDSATAALKGLKLNGSKDYSKYHAVISVNGNAKDKLGNSISLGEDDGTTPLNAQSCVICGMSSGYTCYKRIRVHLANGGSVLITVTETGDGCVKLVWDN